jgi:hypothetical protein
MYGREIDRTGSGLWPMVGCEMFTATKISYTHFFSYKYFIIYEQQWPLVLTG